MPNNGGANGVGVYSVISTIYAHCIGHFGKFSTVSHYPPALGNSRRYTLRRGAVGQPGLFSFLGENPGVLPQQVIYTDRFFKAGKFFHRRFGAFGQF